MYVCFAGVYVWTPSMNNACGNQKKVSDALEHDMVFVSCRWVQGTEPRSPGRTHALGTEPSLQSLTEYLTPLLTHLTD